MENEQIMVSVSCLVYNHEKYLRKCLDGFIMQKTNFKFEVLVHDDASTDGSQDIIREYEEKYPDIIKPIYQTENQFSKRTGIMKTFQLPRARGKYFAYCEGDDYWCDENKLQRQFDILESHPDCSICTHTVGHIKENGELTDNRYPAIHLSEGVHSNTEIFSYLFGEGLYMFQLSSFFFRREVLNEYYESMPYFVKKSMVGDTPLLLYLLNLGNLYYIDGILSHYRLFTDGSWTSRNCSTDEGWINFWENKANCYKLYNEYTEYKYNDVIQKSINNLEFDICLKKKQYFKLFKRKLRPILKERYNIKERMYLLINALSPSLIKALKK